MALITTVTTTPMTMALYPPWYQKKIEAWKRGEIDWEGNSLLTDKDGERTPDRIEQLSGAPVRRLLVYLRLDSLPGLFTFISLLGGERPARSAKIHKDKDQLPVTDSATHEATGTSRRPFEVHGIRMLELTDRTSSVMQSSEVDHYAFKDPVVNTFRTFAQLNNVAVSGSVSIVPQDSYAETLTNTADDQTSDLVLVPWSESVSDVDSAADSLKSGLQDAFIQKIVSTSAPNIAIFVNQGFGAQSPDTRALSRTMSAISIRSRFNHEPALQPIADISHHIYFPFFGGADDRVALRFVLQIAQNNNITATIVHFHNSPHADTLSESKGHVETTTSSSLNISRVNTETLHASTARDASLLQSLRDSLPLPLADRVVFTEHVTTTPLADCLSRARAEVGQLPRNAGDLIVVGRGRHSLLTDSSEVVSSEIRKTLGSVAESIISGGVRGSVLVFSAGTRDADIRA